LTSGKKPSNNYIEGWLGHTACLDFFEKEIKSLAPTGIRTSDSPPNNVKVSDLLCVCNNWLRTTQCCNIITRVVVLH